jgi:hypothetical protein
MLRRNTPPSKGSAAGGPAKRSAKVGDGARGLPPDSHDKVASCRPDGRRGNSHEASAGGPVTDFGFAPRTERLRCAEEGAPHRARFGAPEPSVRRRRRSSAIALRWRCQRHRFRWCRRATDSRWRAVVTGAIGSDGVESVIDLAVARVCTACRWPRCGSSIFPRSARAHLEHCERRPSPDSGWTRSVPYPDRDAPDPRSVNDHSRKSAHW